MALIGPGPGTRDLRDFLKLLEERGQLRRITAPVDPDLELAAIADRVLAAGGPALLFENVIGSSMPVAVNIPFLLLLAFLPRYKRAQPFRPRLRIQNLVVA